MTERETFTRAEVEELWDTVERCVNTILGAVLVQDRDVISENAVKITATFEKLIDGDTQR